MNLGGTFNGQTTREDFKAAFSLASLAPHRADEPATIGRCSCRLADSGGEKTAVLRPRMGKKLDPIENAGFRQTYLNGAGQR